VLQNARELKIDLSGVSDVILSHIMVTTSVGSDAASRACQAKPRGPQARVRRRGDLPERGPILTAASQRGSWAQKEYEALGGSFAVIERPAEIFPGAWLTARSRALISNGTGASNARSDSRTAVTWRTTYRRTCPRARHRERPGTDLRLRPCRHHQHPRICPPEGRQTVVHAALGGFHLFEADSATLDWTAAKLRPMELSNFLGAHCTGIEPVYQLRQRLGQSRGHCSVGAVGSRFTLRRWASIPVRWHDNSTIAVRIMARVVILSGAPWPRN